MKLLVPALALALLFSGCHESALALQPGKPCVVQFRRDALGAGASLPIPPLTQTMNGAETCVAGTFERTAGHWIVIQQNGVDVWIPESVVLAITQ